MAITDLAATETVSGTEWSFATDTSYDTGDAQTTDGALQCWFDVNAIAAGDQFQFRVYEKISSGGTQRIVYEVILSGAQPQPILVLPTLTVMYGWDATVKKLAGTDRSIIGSLRLVPL